MTSIPRKQGLSAEALAAVLDAIRAGRNGMISLRKAYSHRSAIYREAGHLIDDMDGMTLLLTGKRDYFHETPHSTSPGFKPDKG